MSVPQVPNPGELCTPEVDGVKFRQTLTGSEIIP